MTHKTENIHEEMLKLNSDSRTVRTAHFIAAQEKGRNHRVLGVFVILLNIMIFSPLFDLVAPKQSPIIIKFLAIIAASFAGIQTLFTFQRDAESHLNAGDAYGTINRRIRILLAEYNDQAKDASQITAEFKELHQEYLQANKDYKGIAPSEKEYDKAREVLKNLDKKRGVTAPTTSECSVPNSITK